MKLRIVIFEDDPGLRRLLTVIFDQEGHEVLSFPNPGGACPIYHDEKGQCPQDYACGDILITDNRMPRMTGLEFIRRQVEKGCKGAILNKAVMSASWCHEDIRAAENLGCRILYKPFRLDDLKNWVRERQLDIDPVRKLALLH